MHLRGLFWSAALIGVLASSAHGWAVETIICEAGGNLALTGAPNGVIVTGLSTGSTPALAGECAAKTGMPLTQGGNIFLAFSNNVVRLQEIKKIVNEGSGTFTVQVNVDERNQASMVVTVLNVMDAHQPQMGGGAPVGGGDDMEDDGAADAGGGAADMGGGDDEVCPAGMATVSIPEENLNRLNIREEPDGKVIGKVPEGGTVSVVGECGGAAGFAAPDPDRIWCEIDQPKPGCVREFYLDFGGVAGFAKKRN